MSDDALNEGASQEAAASSAGGGVPEFVILILKIVGIILGAILLTVVVSYVMFQILSSDRPSQNFAETSPAYEAKPPILQWYDLMLTGGTDSIRARTRDEKSVNVKVSFGYDLNNTALQTELINQNRRWFDLIRSHISGSLLDEIKNEQQFKEEIRRKVNQILASGQIREVLFINFEIFDN